MLKNYYQSDKINLMKQRKFKAKPKTFSENSTMVE